MRFAPSVPLFLALIGGCSGGPNARVDRADFYERLNEMAHMHNSSADARDFKRQSSIELELQRMTTPHYDWLSRDAIEEQDDDRRNLATWGLAFCRQPQSADVLARVLDDKIPVVRASAAFGLGRQSAGDPPLDRLFAMTDDPIPYVRQGALFALKQLLKPGQDDPKRLPRVAALLDDSSLDVRNEAVQVLGRLRNTAGIDPLCRKGLSDASFLVRLHSALALGGYGGDAMSSIPFLVEALRDPETSVVEAAWWALKKVTGLDYDRSYHLWRDWFEQDQRRFEYVCRDHPAVIKETAGFCPDCGKRLDRQPKLVKKPGDDDIYVCPNHPEVTGGPGGRCSKCKMAMIPLKK